MITRETIFRPKTVSFYFDPICPWTWITSRWLAEVQEARGFRVDWRTLSLAELNGGVENMPERYQEMGRFSMGALRMIEAMRAAGDYSKIGPFYTVLGTALYVDGVPAGRTLLENSADATGVLPYLPAHRDSRWDARIAESTARAIELAGPDTGSPVVQLGDSPRGVHGPILSPAPTGEDALKVWDAMVALEGVPAFFELKHGRIGAPQVQPVEAQAADVRA
jgi:hypothetical protein